MNQSFQNSNSNNKLTLDRFQVLSIEALKANKHCLVSAPTGAGKTLIAEIYIQETLPLGKRIAYTSPIKALSNQKFRQFSKLFPGNVGLLTGEISFNREAPFLIMTTEIYRNMVMEKKNPGEKFNFDLVVFDEIHFIGKRDRGSVWEEAIIFSQAGVQFLGLSASISNADELGSWLEALTGKQCEVIFETRRPVPLKHLVYSKRSGLKPASFCKKLFFSRGRVSIRGRSSTRETYTNVRRLIQELRKSDYLPVLYFIFSRAKTLEFAKALALKNNFSKAAEKKVILAEFNEVCDKYGLHDLESTQNLKEILSKGIGIHHAGLLPQFKEKIESFFDRKLLNVLFVTETFAVGVNMPAKTVVFDSFKKFDGISTRQITPGEYLQLAGRAGRRGIDKQGFAVCNYENSPMNYEQYLEIIHSQSEPVESQIDLSFNSVLNILSRFEMSEIRILLKKNFAQFVANQKISIVSDDLLELKERLTRAILLCDKGDMPQFLEFQRKLKDYRKASRRQNLEIRNSMKGRRNQTARHLALKTVKERFNRFIAKEKSFTCATCPDKSACLPAGYERQRIEALLIRKKYFLDNERDILWPQFQKKLFQLEIMGYTKGKEVLPRGWFASRIHYQEIFVTELIFDGFFHQASKHLINAMIANLVFEGKPGIEFPKTPRKHEVRTLKKYKKLFNFHPQLKDMGVAIDNRVDYLVYLWSEKWSLEKLLTITSYPEGDFIKLIRQTIDLEKQIIETCDSPELKRKLKGAMALLNRGIVLATENILEGSSAAESSL
ncbi:DEAD/DEAH box helicase [Candidatus Riflebacteria bacterium]